VAPAFVCRQLTKRYGATTALAGVDLDVEPGELLGLLGPNGAGKSTLTKIACGLVRACSGHAEVEGAPAGSTRARSAIGYLAELFRFPDWLSADELLALHQSLAGSEGGPRERMELLELVELGHAQATRVDAMSKGMQQRLGIAQALVGRPRLLMLDEPTSALDPVGRHIVRDLLREVRDRGVAVVLSSHLLSEVELVCDRVAILNGGRIVARGTPNELARPHGVEIHTGSGLRSYPRASREEVPGIVAALVAQGEEIYEVRILSSTLEDAYLEAVGAGHVAAPAPAEDAA
jgi:ABC-2 type transport system ATP-binding protein